MGTRCRNPKDESFQFYGGKGITICERWVSFDNFLADMGERPPGTTLDRLDSAKDYEPGNCRWSTPIEQGRSSKRMARFNGKVMSRTEIAAELGIGLNHLCYKVRTGKLMLETL